MSNFDKKDFLKRNIKRLINLAMEDLDKTIDKALDSGAIDIDNWDEDSYVLPKAIATAILLDMSEQFIPHIDSSFKKEFDENLNNIKLYL